MEAIVLAGGFGTRLSKVVSDLPKPMVPICNRPFLEYILLDLSKKGVTKVVLAVGYKSDIIYNWFGESYLGLKLIYSYEDKPLFTGGAIKKALLSCEDEEVFIINGDTLFDIDLHSMFAVHKKSNAMLTVAIKEMTNFSRYGTVQFDEKNHIISFEEKKYHDKGYINGGIYLLNKNALNGIDREKFSFEQEYLQSQYLECTFFVFRSNGYFIDIGIPEDYEKAKNEFKNGGVEWLGIL